MLDFRVATSTSPHTLGSQPCPPADDAASASLHQAIGSRGPKRLDAGSAMRLKHSQKVKVFGIRPPAIHAYPIFVGRTRRRPGAGRSGSEQVIKRGAWAADATRSTSTCRSPASSPSPPAASSAARGTPPTRRQTSTSLATPGPQGRSLRDPVAASRWGACRTPRARD